MVRRTEDGEEDRGWLGGQRMDDGRMNQRRTEERG